MFFACWGLGVWKMCKKHTEMGGFAGKREKIVQKITVFGRNAGKREKIVQKITVSGRICRKTGKNCTENHRFWAVCRKTQKIWARWYPDSAGAGRAAAPPPHPTPLQPASRDFPCNFNGLIIARPPGFRAAIQTSPALRRNAQYLRAGVQLGASPGRNAQVLRAVLSMLQPVLAMSV